MKGANSNYMKHATTLPLAERRPLMNHEWQAITFQTDDTARIYLDQCIYETIHPLRFTKQGVMCILQSPADSDAFQSGRCAKHNGRPETMYF